MIILLLILNTVAKFICQSGLAIVDWNELQKTTTTFTALDHCFSAQLHSIYFQECTLYFYFFEDEQFLHMARFSHDKKSVIMSSVHDRQDHKIFFFMSAPSEIEFLWNLAQKNGAADRWQLKKSPSRSRGAESARG